MNEYMIFLTLLDQVLYTEFETKFQIELSGFGSGVSKTYSESSLANMNKCCLGCGQCQQQTHV